MTRTEQKLREALEKARVIIVAHNEAEHMLDGFGPRTHQGSDDLLIEIDAALAAPSPGRAPTEPGDDAVAAVVIAAILRAANGEG